jgi:hypothetical protein
MDAFPQQPAPNRPAGYDPKTGRIYEAPWYDPSGGVNPLQDVLKQLMGGAGPRGATYAGRVIPQGTTPNLKQLLTQQPQESPDAEGMGGPASLAMAKVFKSGASQATRTIGSKKFKDRITQFFDAPADAVPDMPFHQMPAAVKNLKTGEIISTGARDSSSINSGLAYHDNLRKLIPQGSDIAEGFVDPKTGFFYPREFIENQELTGQRLMQRYAR